MPINSCRSATSTSQMRPSAQVIMEKDKRNSFENPSVFGNILYFNLIIKYVFALLHWVPYLLIQFFELTSSHFILNHGAGFL